MRFQSDTELAWLRTVIQMEAASGSGRCLPALREAEAILEAEADGHPHVGGGNPRTGAANPGPPFPPTAAIPLDQGERNDGETHAETATGTATADELGSAALILEPTRGMAAQTQPVAQDSPDTQTHRVVVGYEVQSDKSARPVWEEHPVGSCANCRKERVRA